MKYWTVNKETLEVIGFGDADKWNMPRDVLLVEPLPKKEGFAVVAKADLSGTEYVADYREQIIYNTANSLESKQVSELGDIEEGWTLIEPPHMYVVWDVELSDWANDIEARRVAKYAEISNWRTSEESDSSATVTVDGIAWDANPSARARIGDALTSNYVAPFWTDANNVDQFSYDLQAIWDAIVERGVLIHQRQREMKTELAELTTFDEIDSYVVGWGE